LAEANSVFSTTTKCHARPVKIRQLFISPGHNFFGHRDQPLGGHPLIECAEINCVPGRGIAGDRFFDFKDDYQGQITFFAAEVFDGVCRQLGVSGKSAGSTRRNVITADADLNSLVGVEFEIQGVRFAGTAECSPCHWMDEVIAPGAEAALQRRGGLRARILSDGKMRVNK
jgi:MOSC domain-containing protein YiiM